MRTLRRPAALAAVLTLTAGLVAALPASAADRSPSWHHPSSGERYVALGDSFVAGPGIPTQQPGGCARSDHNFPSLVAAEIGAKSFTDASCSAARTTHYWNPQTIGGETVPPQLDALNRKTTLVTLGTMGGNDVGLVGLAQTCLVQGCSTLPTQPFHDAIDALAPVYERLIADVRERSPRATIVAVGYGTYVPRETCAALVNATSADLAYLQSMIDRLSDTIGEVAADEGVAFVDMRDIEGWQEHSGCAAPEEQWVRALNPYGDGAPLHPSTAGMEQMADQALKVIEPLVRARRASAWRVAAAAHTVRLHAVCHGPSRRSDVTLRVTGGKGLATAALFHIGDTTVGADTRAPFALTRSARSLRDLRGSVHAKVTLKHGTVSHTTSVRTSRPKCLR
ncbi:MULTISPECIES: SGNH/GDSL hydrolase family protein [Aeromicrobium]|uniref:SGNH/GDSL hydrolase family protein n=1 Tax=Aeromicrobium phoceense TaxID=2754045 RepID=A0A838XDV7_9ACTN|nr:MULTISPECIES: SGNH/GDSL hydrolase family protein [Aeromicrobium]MBA4606866.1 SGNH/GDSL hydrolase family protein [Aeromicrobium phoceense]